MSLHFQIYQHRIFILTEVSCEHVEGGLYIGPEFLLGEVYDGTIGHESQRETVVLYRPVYVTVVKPSTQHV
jgi:hypothetical protein